MNATESVCAARDFGKCPFCGQPRRTVRHALSCDKAPVSEGLAVEPRGESLSGFPHRPNFLDGDEESMGRILDSQDAAKVRSADPSRPASVLDKLLRLDSDELLLLSELLELDSS